MARIREDLEAVEELIESTRSKSTKPITTRLSRAKDLFNCMMMGFVVWVMILLLVKIGSIR